MHLANPPTTLAEAIEQLTERTQQLEASRRDFNEWYNECQTARQQRDDLLVKLSLIQCPHCKMVYDHR